MSSSKTGRRSRRDLGVEEEEATDAAGLPCRRHEALGGAGAGGTGIGGESLGL
jgi:hypothetical protein